MADESENAKENAYEGAKQKFIAESDKMMSFISDYIVGEKYIDTLALLLIYAGEEKAQAILGALSSEFAEKLRNKLASIALKGDDIKRDSPKVISEVGTVMRKEGFFGVHSSDSLMQSLLPEEKNELKINIDDFFEINPLLALNAEKNLFDFKDILKLDDRSIQKMLREVEMQEIATALKGADEEVQNKIFRNMSRRAASMLKEDIEFMGPVRPLDVQQSQQNIEKIVRKLQKSGEIVIPNDEDVEMIV